MSVSAPMLSSGRQLCGAVSTVGSGVGVGGDGPGRMWEMVTVAQRNHPAKDLHNTKIGAAPAPVVGTERLGSAPSSPSLLMPSIVSTFPFGRLRRFWCNKVHSVPF